MSANRVLELTATNSTGSFEEDFLLSEFNGHEPLSGLFEYQLTVQCRNDDVDLEALLGTTISMKMAVGRFETERFFHGYITSFVSKGWEGRHAVYDITLGPWLGFLEKTQDSRIYQQLSVPDIVSSIFEENGFSDYELQLSGVYDPIEYCVQYQESDFAFISRLLEQEGIYYHFRQEEDKHTLILCDSPSAHSHIPSCETVPFYPPGSTVRSDYYIDSWEHALSVATGVFSSNAFDFTKPRASLSASSSITKAHDYSDFEVYEYNHGYTERDSGERYAQIRMERMHAESQEFRGTSNNPRFHTGGLFGLDNHPVAATNSDYLLTSVDYHASVSLYESGQETETYYQVSFNAIPAELQYRPAQQAEAPTISGSQTAVVVGPAGEEIWTDEYGRVKVQFHWDRYGERNENSSCWVRVSQLWAGGNWGAIYIPRIGQEVIVEFLSGNPDNPLITGRVYNADNMPPYELPNNQAMSGIKSRSTKGGSIENYNELRFDDSKGQELLTLHAEKDQLIEVENDEMHTVGHDREKRIGNDETVNVARDRTETVGNNETISIENNRSEKVAKDETIKIGQNRTENVGKNETISIGENRVTDVGKNETLSVTDNRNVSIGKNEQQDVGKNRTTNVGENEMLDVGKRIIIQAGDEIVLKAGGAQITLSKNGDITIDGANITLKGSGNIVMKGSKIQSN